MGRHWATAAAAALLLGGTGLGAPTPAVDGTGAEVAPAAEIAVPPGIAEAGSRPDAMAALARAVLRARRDAALERLLDERFRLQLVSRDYREALSTLGRLRELRRATVPERAAWVDVQHEIFARAQIHAGEGIAQDEAYRTAFREVFASLDDRAAAMVARALTAVDPGNLRRDLEGTLERQAGKPTAQVDEALALLRAYQVATSYELSGPLAGELVAADDERRYVVERDIRVPARDGATLCALVVRPRVAGRLPALLNFTIYADPIQNMAEARRTASHGYAGVVGLTRGKGCSPQEPVPYEHDGVDAATVVDWIARQPWSDGRVGMYGGSYEGFTPWAAAKHRPEALKAIMTGAPVAPGIDVPMEGNVFWSFVYSWPFYTTNNKTLDAATSNDFGRWNRLSREWYVSGRRYRDLDLLDGTPNPVFRRWLDHPAYDRYWQSMIPYGREFAAIDIPALTTAGYYYGGPGAAVHYFGQHVRHDPKAEHYLVIGPYDHVRGHRGTINALGEAFTAIAGYELDPVAQLDMGELRYEWFDHVLRGGPKPRLLRDRVNYQVAGANEWKHAPTLAEMSDRTVRFFLTGERSAGAYRLAEQAPAPASSLLLRVDLADRSDVDRERIGGGVLDSALDTANALELVSDPFPTAVEISGLFSGRLELVTNKRDFDLAVSLFGLTPDGTYVQLAPFWARASYLEDPTRRQLLEPGRREALSFTAIRLTGRRLPPGSRLVAVLGVVKELGRQINYGTGKDVSDETIADAGDPLEIRWSTGSYLDVPIRIEGASGPSR